MNATLIDRPNPAATSGDRAEAPAWPASRDWPATPLAERARVIGRLRGRLVEHAAELVAAVGTPFDRRPTDTLAAEILPLAEAARFVARSAPRLLRARRLGRRGRPLWLAGVDASLRFEPFGRVLVIGPRNYPLMLPGIHALQALAAGNSVAIKPAPGCAEPMRRLAGLLRACGVPADAIAVLDESVEAARDALGQADKVVLTGSEATGRAVLRRLAETATPAVMELSGCDAVFVLPGADLHRVVACLRFGLTFNGSATCIAPRRVFVHRSLHEDLTARLRSAMPRAAIRYHLPLDAMPTEDTLSPTLALMPVANMDEALAADARCGFCLGCSIFGPAAEAEALAARVDAGSVCINDIIAPTADPRLPFAGRRRSGFGATRGAAGLLEMAKLKAVSHRRGGLTRHLDEPDEHTGAMLEAILRAAHAPRWTGRLRGWLDVVRVGRRIHARKST